MHMRAELPSDGWALTLIGLVDLMKIAQRPWWIISSAAAALHGEVTQPPADVDVLIAPEDALSIARQLELQAAPGIPCERFHSEIFIRWEGLPLPVEFMAGFHLHEQGQWRPVQPSSRQPVNVAGVTLHIPDRSELIRLLRRFGRDKDLVRAQRLEEAGRWPPQSP